MGNEIADRASDAEVARIGSRIDQMPPSRQLWGFVALIATGGFFEIYDLALTGPISAGLVAAKIFRTGHDGMFGLADQATFILATFSGLYLGVVGFMLAGDRLGRRAVFAYSLVWYAAATALMGLSNTAGTVSFWRFVAGIGLGAEAVAIDCFVVEIVPARLRGRAFSLSMCVQYLAIPASALLAALLIPEPVLDVPGWRWITFVPVLGAVGFWLVRRGIPESPRWLASKGRLGEADSVLDRLGAPTASAVPAPVPVRPSAVPGSYLRRTTIMLLVYTNLQGTAYYGFSNWLPTLLESQGVPLKQSLFYTFGTTIAAPLAALALGWYSDKFERKSEIIFFGLAAIVLAILFGWASEPVGWLSFGLCLSFANSTLSVLTHNYLAEVFPTAIRARFVGFVYSFTRLSAALSGYLIAWLLEVGGAKLVFASISAFMVVAVAAVAVAGPRTRGRPFEAIAGQV